MTSHSQPTGHLRRLAAVRTITAIALVFGYSSTMNRGPGAAEWGRLFEYEPSLFAVQVLFFLAGWLALRSLHRHGSGWKLLRSRARRNLPLLAVVTAIVAFVLYPLIAPGDAPMGLGERLGYFVQTVSCADPGQPMPGALDDAHYACLLQGAIWTFRWGALAYIGTALLWHVGLLRGRGLVTLGAASGTVAYFGLHFYLAKLGAPDGSRLFDASAGLSLAYPFAVGMAAFAWRDRLPASLLPAVALLAVACANYLFLPWTPLIPILSTLALCWLALHLVEHGRAGWLEDWPDHALPLFVVNWPLCQTLLWLFPDISTGSLVASTLAGSLLFALALRAPQRLRRPFSPPAFSQAKTARTP